MMKKRVSFFIIFIVCFSIQFSIKTLSTFAMEPLFEFESSETFTPTFASPSGDDSVRKLPPITIPKESESLGTNNLSQVRAEKLEFQLAPVKGMYLETPENMQKLLQLEEEEKKLSISSQKKDDVKPEKVVESEKTAVETTEVGVDFQKEFSKDLERNFSPRPVTLSEVSKVDPPVVEADESYYEEKYSVESSAEEELEEKLKDKFFSSSFYTVLKDNNYKNIQVHVDRLDKSLPELIIVNYDIPLGGDGEYACQVMVLKDDKGVLQKFWLSEFIPGEMDTIMIQDINEDGQNDIASISATGGVSLLKSIRIYSLKKASTFNTIFAMNSIMEGLVTVRKGRILVSETFPGGFNRAALYVWNGRIFERLEL